MVEFSPMTRALMMNNRRFMLGERPSLGQNLEAVREIDAQNRVRGAQAQAWQQDASEVKRRQAVLSQLDLNDPRAVEILIKAGLLNEAKALSQARGGTGADAPSSVREFQYFQNLTPEEQRNFMRVKRATPSFDLGGDIVTLDPIDQAISQTYPKTLTPAQRPETMAAQETAKVTGKAIGEEEVAVTKAKTRMPEVMSTVDRLHELSQKADFSLKDRGVNFMREQVLGKEATEGSLAATEYRRVVEMELLPSLSDIFKGPISDSERESVMAMLGNPNDTPEQKRAALKSYIEKKKQQIESKESSLIELRRRQAQEAIAANRDPDVIRAQFKQMTGEDL